jgi:hypothetical protein
MRAKFLLIPLAALILSALACNGPMTSQQNANGRSPADPGFYKGGH